MVALRCLTSGLFVCRSGPPPTDATDAGEGKEGPARAYRNHRQAATIATPSRKHRGLALSHRLIISLSLGLSLFSSAATAPLAIGAEAATTTATSTVAATEAPAVPTQEEVEAKVREYWQDAPIMAKVAYCESTFRQFDEDGKPLRGYVNAADVGVMQINETFHKASADRMGINLETLDGNLAYARHLYRTQGTAPWVHSSHCWQS